jgi:ribosomal protein L19E
VVGRTENVGKKTNSSVDGRGEGEGGRDGGKGWRGKKQRVWKKEFFICRIVMR